MRADSCEEPRGAGGGIATDGSKACSAATGWGGGQANRKADVFQLTNVAGSVAPNSSSQQHRPESSLRSRVGRIAVFCSRPQMGQKHLLILQNPRRDREGSTEAHLVPAPCFSSQGTGHRSVARRFWSISSQETPQSPCTVCSSAQSLHRRVLPPVQGNCCAQPLPVALLL